MKNFRINPEPQTRPEPETHYVAVGTRFTFRNVGGQIKAAIHIPVYAA